MKNRAFTLIELLIVIAIIAILATAIIIVITPGERLLQARESTRASHMVAIGTAVHMAVVDGLETCDGSTLCTSVADVLTCTTPNNEFGSACATRVALAEAPQDPQGGNYLTEEVGGRVHVWSPASESDWYCGVGTTCPNTTDSKVF